MRCVPFVSREMQDYKPKIGYIVPNSRQCYRVKFKEHCVHLGELMNTLFRRFWHEVNMIYVWVQHLLDFKHYDCRRNLMALQIVVSYHMVLANSQHWDLLLRDGLE